MTKDMEAAREAVRELDETHNLRLHLGKTVVDTLERRIAAALAKVREECADPVYTERNQCVALIARMARAMGHRVGVARTDIPGWDPEWHGCVYIDLPTGQVSWHFHDRDAHLFDGLPAYKGEWDGHDTAEKYRRVFTLFNFTEAAARALAKEEQKHG